MVCGESYSLAGARKPQIAIFIREPKLSLLPFGDRVNYEPSGTRNFDCGLNIRGNAVESLNFRAYMCSLMKSNYFANDLIATAEL